MFSFGRPDKMPSPADALPGRTTAILEPRPHTVLGTPIAGPYPDGFQIAEFALGCFWGEEKTFWEQPGVWTTAVGYQGGFTPNPLGQGFTLTAGGMGSFRAQIPAPAAAPVLVFAGAFAARRRGR